MITHHAPRTQKRKKPEPRPVLADFFDHECEEEGDDDEGDEGEGDEDPRTEEEKAVDLQERQAFFTQRKKCLTVKQQNDAFHKSCVDKIASLQRVRHRREDEE